MYMDLTLGFEQSFEIEKVCKLKISLWFEAVPKSMV